MGGYPVLYIGVVGLFRVVLGLALLCGFLIYALSDNG